MKRTVMITARKAKGLTQVKLAEKIGISRAHLTNIERGEHTPSLKVAQKLSLELGVRTEELFSVSNARKTNVDNAFNQISRAISTR